MLCLVTELYLTLCDSLDCSLLGSSLHGDSPGKNTGVGCHALLQGIFPTQRSNPSLLHCRWINNSDSPTKPMWTITWKIILNILSLSIKKVESTFHILVVWNISSKNAIILFFFSTYSVVIGEQLWITEVYKSVQIMCFIWAIILARRL